MIGWLFGEVKMIMQHYIILNVNGVGYIVFTDYKAEIGDKVEFYIDMQIRQDQITMFGFDSKLKYDLFLIMMKINGLGGRAVVKIFDCFDLLLLKDILLSSDHNMLKKVSGIGDRIAKRIVSEVKPKEILTLFANYNDDSDDVDIVDNLRVDDVDDNTGSDDDQVNKKFNKKVNKKFNTKFDNVINNNIDNKLEPVSECKVNKVGKARKVVQEGFQKANNKNKFITQNKHTVELDVLNALKKLEVTDEKRVLDILHSIGREVYMKMDLNDLVSKVLRLYFNNRSS